jgi:serine/threonine protein kinase
MSDDYKRGALIDGRFLLERRLGVGGFGSVWRANDALARGLGAKVALKLLHPHLAEIGGETLERFQREAEILQRLDHPNVARPIAFSLEKHPYLAMELVDGITLSKIIEASKEKSLHIPADELMRIFDELCSPIAYAHSLGIVHRDLKPKNVMIVRRADRLFVKVLDFGVSRLIETSRTRATTVGRMLGTYAYMAPEQVKGEAVGPAADQFALGAMLYELLSFERYTKIPAKVSDVRPEIPEELDEVITQAMALEAKDRFAGVEDFAKAAIEGLRRLKEDKTISVMVLGSSIERALEAPPPLKMSMGWPIAVTALALLVAGIVFGFVLYERPVPLEVAAIDVPEPVVAKKPGVEAATASVAEPAEILVVDPPLDAGSIAEKKVRPAKVAREPEKPRDRYPRARLLLEAARRKNGELRAVAELSDELNRRVKETIEGKERTRLLRRIEESALAGDVEGLAACLAALDLASSSR